MSGISRLLGESPPRTPGGGVNLEAVEEEEWSPAPQRGAVRGEPDGYFGHVDSEELRLEDRTSRIRDAVVPSKPSGDLAPNPARCLFPPKE